MPNCRGVTINGGGSDFMFKINWWGFKLPGGWSEFTYTEFTQNALKITTLISLLFSYYSSSTIISLYNAYFTIVINTKVPKSIGGGS